MKRKTICFGIISFIVLTLKLFNVGIGIDKEINLYKYLSFISSNLYQPDHVVSGVDVDVFDYEIKDGKLYIETINSEVRLPINGMILEVGSDYVVIQNSSLRYHISNIRDLRFHLYEHYESNLVLGYSDNVIISSDSYHEIVSGLIINYEKV